MIHVVIVGAGFGGLAAAKALTSKGRGAVKLTLVDSKNHHLFQPLLYQVATAGLSPADIAVPIRSLIRAKQNAVDVLMQTVADIDSSTKKITFADGESMFYDVLLLACGAGQSYFGHDEWESHAPSLKTLEEATDIRRRILEAFERAENTTDESLRRELLTFVIVGAGPTGVELAGAIGEISRKTLAEDFNRIDPSSTRIVLIEGSSRILNSFSEDLSRHATRDLEKLGVTVWTSMQVTEISEDGVRLGPETLKAKTVLWAAGVKPSNLCKKFPTSVHKSGRLVVNENLQVLNAENVFAIGDMAAFTDKKLGILPGLAPVAMQQGRHVADNILRLVNKKPLKIFNYLDKGQMATIGRRRAVAQFKGIELTGFIAWFAWLFIHIYYLVGFRSKLFVFIQWVGSYVFFKRGARLITGKRIATQ